MFKRCRLFSRNVLDITFVFHPSSFNTVTCCPAIELYKVMNYPFGTSPFPFLSLFISSSREWLFIPGEPTRIESRRGVLCHLQWEPFRS